MRHMNTHPVRAYREKNGLTQSALAEVLGCSQSHIALVESGKRGLSREMAREWAERTGLDPMVLLWPDSAAA